MHTHNASTPNEESVAESFRPIKWSVLWPFVLVLLFVIGAFLTAVYLEQQRFWQHEIKEWSAVADRLLTTRLSGDSESLRGVLFTLFENPEIAQAFAKRDREQLLELTKPLFAHLRTQGISHLYFILPDRTTLLRVHTPGRWGDRIERPSMRQVQHSGKGTSGLELGPLGTLTLRAVEPWSVDGHLLGYVELGEPIARLLEQVHSVLGYDLVVLGDKQFLDQERWRVGKSVSGNSWPWDRLPDSVGLGSTLRNPPPELIDFLASAGHPQTTLLAISGSGASLTVLVHPLKNMDAGKIAELVLVRDVTSRRERISDTLAIATGLSLAVGGGVFIVLLFILERVEQNQRRHQTLKSQFTRLSREHRRIVQVEKLSAMGMMVGEIAHQINNPLVGVINMAQLAQREADHPQRVRHLLTNIQNAGVDCRTLVQRMLEFAKIARFERETRDLPQLMESTVQLALQSLSPRPHIELDLPAAPVRLQLDPVLLRHALFNLLTNAVQAGPPQATIRLQLEEAASDPESGRSGWCIKVLDEGHGFSEEVRARAFEPFFSTRTEGTGLGLLVVQQVALLHHGRVELRNRPQGGAEVALWLPDNDGGEGESSQDSAGG